MRYEELGRGLGGRLTLATSRLMEQKGYLQFGPYPWLLKKWIK